MTKYIVLPWDDRPGQILRVADYMEQHPEGVTIPQIEAACDPGSVTKLLSVMRKTGYIFKKIRSTEICQNGTKQRNRWLFILVSRPANAQTDLFEKT